MNQWQMDRAVTLFAELRQWYTLLSSADLKIENYEVRLEIEAITHCLRAQIESDCDIDFRGWHRDAARRKTPCE